MPSEVKIGQVWRRKAPALGRLLPGAHRISGRHLMSEVVEAFIREYGHRPENRREQDLYGAFRFGYEAGQKSGAREERDRIKKVIGDD